MHAMETTALALEELLRATGDPLARLRAIGPGHPDRDRAHVLRSAAAVLAKSPEALPALATELERADRPDLTPDARSHLEAARAWLAGDPVLAAERYAGILARWPGDLLALRLAQSCYFFVGWHHRLLSVVDDAIAAWPRDGTGFEAVLAMASFAHAENGDAERAETLGRQALANDPACPLGVHAVAHAFAESGRHGGGARWMREQRAHWDGESRMRTHNAWHLAMFDVEDGNAASALEIFDGWLLPASTQAALDACDAAALLWRLEHTGIDVARRWRALSDAFEKTLTPGYWPYVDLHAALTHRSAGAAGRVRRLGDAIAHRATRNDYAGLRARRITLPGLRALAVWQEGGPEEAAARLAELQPLLAFAGGSRIQWQLFADLGRSTTHRPVAGAAAASTGRAGGPTPGATIADATRSAAGRTVQPEPALLD